MNEQKAFETQEAPKDLTIEDQWYDAIRDRKKTLELRPGYPEILLLKKGDQIAFKTRHGDRVRVIIKDLRTYAMMDQVFATENLSKLYPDMATENIRPEAALRFPDAHARSKRPCIIEFEVII